MILIEKLREAIELSDVGFVFYISFAVCMHRSRCLCNSFHLFTFFVEILYFIYCFVSFHFNGVFFVFVFRFYRHRRRRSQFACFFHFLSLTLVFYFHSG